MLDRLLHRWPLKLLAVAAAYAIWLSVSSQGRVFVDYDVPLDLRIEEAFVIAGGAPDEVEVRLRGKESVLRNLDPLRLLMHVVLDPGGPGEQNVLLSQDQLRGLPRGLEVTRIRPDRLRLDVDSRMQRLVPVRANLVDAPPEGYRLYAVQVVPHSVEIDGPQRSVGTIEEVSTQPVSVGGRTEAAAVTALVVPEASGVRVLGDNAVEVRLNIDADPVQRVFDGVPVLVVDATHETRVEPGTARITVSGPPSVVGGLRADQVRAVADVGGLSPGRRAQRVPLEIEIAGLPAGVRARLTTTGRREVSVFISERELDR